jgi:uncharacterized cupredoxin-like copper-binding protein
LLSPADRAVDPESFSEALRMRQTNSSSGHYMGCARPVIVGLMIALGMPAVGLATDWRTAKPITVVTTESKFTPNKLSFRRGIPYKLHVENHGKELHEFNAADLFKASKINNPAVLNADKTELVLHPGEAKDLYFIPKQAGHFKLVCPDHDWAGMTGEITVE